jgi:hypothetical protein
VTDPVSTLKTVYDLLAGLVSAKHANKKAFFETQVEPIQKKLARVHADYQKGFTEVRSLLDKRETSSNELAHLRELLEFLRERRREYEAERQLLQDLGTELRKAGKHGLAGQDWALVEAYCQAVVHYFTAGARAGGATGYSWFTDLIEIVERNARLLENHSKQLERDVTMNVWFTTSISGNPMRDLREGVDQVLNKDLPYAFSQVTNAYAALRAHLL